MIELEFTHAPVLEHTGEEYTIVDLLMRPGDTRKQSQWNYLGIHRIAPSFFLYTGAQLVNEVDDHTQGKRVNAW